jgi:hypothetical protein
VEFRYCLPDVIRPVRLTLIRIVVEPIEVTTDIAGSGEAASTETIHQLVREEIHSQWSIPVFRTTSGEQATTAAIDGGRRHAFTVAENFQ